jgi:hypothetical protein
VVYCKNKIYHTVRTVPEKQNIPHSQDSSLKTKYTTQSRQFLKNKIYHTVRTVPEKQLPFVNLEIN